MLSSRPRPWVIAHRGVPLEMPENTLIGFMEAIQQGADFIELDVRQTADGHLVVIHDETVDRTTDGTGPVSAKSLAELQALDAGRWMGPDFTGQRIPTLLEVLELTRDQVGVVIEIKAGSQVHPDIEARVVDLIRRTGRMADVLIISADCQAVRTVKRLETQLATLCFQHASPEDISSEARHSDALFVWPDDLTPDLIQAAHARSLLVLSSLLGESVLEPARCLALKHVGVDGVFTNEAGPLRQLWGR